LQLLACRRFGCCCLGQFLFALAFITLQICTSEKKRNKGEEEEEEKEEKEVMRSCTFATHTH
jgi:hypothetical protein